MNDWAMYLAGLRSAPPDAPQIAAPGDGRAVFDPWLLGYDDDEEDSDGN